MKRLLLRSPKDPFEVVSPRTAYQRNLIGDNSGNLIFLQATHRILDTSDQELVAGSFSTDPALAPTVNEQFDAYVMALANAFRVSYEPGLQRITRFLQRLTIPVVILGVGAQSDAKYRFDRLKPIERSVRRFVAAVLDRAPSIGVRGELTADYLRGLGFRDVEVIGCPSMFLDGNRLRVAKRRPELDRDAVLSLNVSPYVRAMAPIVASHVERYPNLTYVAQDHRTLGILLRGGELRPSPSADPRMPFDPGHPLFRQGRVRFYVEPWPWIDDLRGADFSFGTRIHGNIAALLAGTPAYVFAHDSRTLELARYFQIPHRAMKEVPADIDAAALYAEAEYGGLVDGHAARFATFAAYLHRHGLRHAWDEGEDPAAFMERVAATPYPPAVTVPRVMLRASRGRGRVVSTVHRIVVASREAVDWLMAQAWRVRRLARRLRRRLG